MKHAHRGHSRLLAPLLSLTLVSQAFAEIPDRVNIEKFEGLYNEAKSKSDNAEAKRVQLYNAHSTQLNLSNSLKQTHENKRVTLQDNLDLQGRLRIEIPQLQEEIRVKRANLVDFAKDLASKKGTRDEKLSIRNQIQSDRNRENDYLSRLETAYQQAYATWAQGLDLVNRTKAEISRLYSHNSNLESQNEDLRTRRRATQFQISDLESELSSLRSRIAGLEAELSNKRSTLGNVQSRSSDLASQLDSESRRGQDLYNSLTQTTNERNAVSAQVDQIFSEIQALQQQLASLSTTKADLQARRQNLRARLNELEQTVIPRISGNLTRATQRLENTQMRIRNLRGNLRPLTEEKQATNQSLRKETRKLERLKSEPLKFPAVANRLKALEEKKSQQEGRLANVVSELNTLNNQIAQKQTQVTQSEETLKQSRQSLRQSKNQLKRLTDGLPGMQQNLQQKTQRAGQVRTNLEGLVSEIAALEATKTQQEQALKAVTDQIGPLRERKKEISKQLRRSQKQLEKLKSKPNPNPNQVQRIARLEQSVADLTSQQEEVNNQLSELNSQKGQLEPLLAQTDQALKQKKNQSQTVTTRLNKLQSQISELQSNLANADTRRAELRTTIASLESAIPGQQQAVQTGKNELRELNRQTNPLSRRKENLEGKIGETSQAIRGIRSNPSSVPAYANALASSEAAIASFNSKISDLDGRIAPLRQNIQNNVQTKGEIEGRIQKFNENLIAAQDEFEKKTKRIRRVRRNIQDTNSALANGQAALTQKESEMQERSSYLARLEQSISSLTAEYEVNQRNVRDLDAQLRRSQTRASTLASEIASLEESLGSSQSRQSQARNELQGARDFLSSSAQTIAQNESQMRSNDSDIAQLENDLPSYEAEEQRLAGLRDEAEGARNQQAQVVAGWDADLREAQNILNQWNQAVVAVERQITAANNVIANNTNRIALNRQTLATKDSENSTLRVEIASLAARIISEDQALAALAKELKDQTDLAALLKSEMETALARYNQVQAHYDERFAFAEKQGVDLGSEKGDESAKGTGDLESEKLAKLQGEELGANWGKLQGEQDGLYDGLKEGKEKGYEHGFNAPENYQEGFDAGKEQGIKDAEKVAREEDYPRGRRSVRNSRFSQVPTQVVRLQNRITGPEFNFNEAVFNEHHFSNDNQSDGQFFEESANVEEQILSEISTLDFTIERTETNYSDLLASGGVVTQVSVPQVSAMPHCQFEHPDFERVCESRFDEHFKDTFEKNYEGYFQDNFREVLPGFVQGAFGQAKTGPYQVAKTRAYDLLYAMYDSIGAEDARNKGFSDGKEEGYTTHIQSARRNAFAKGEQDENSYFASNAVIKLNSVSAVASSGSFYPLGRVSLTAQFTNFGERASQAGAVQMRIIPITGNFRVIKGLDPVVSLPANKKAIVSGIGEIELSRSLRVNEVVSFRVQALYGPGQWEEKIVELRGQRHVAASKSVRGETNPKYRWYNKTKEIFVTVRNNSLSSTPESFRMRLISPDSRIEIKTEPQVFTLGRGESKEFELAFKLTEKSVRGHNFDFTLLLEYGSGRREVLRDTIQIRVKD